jgi:hypothetical protein
MAMLYNMPMARSNSGRIVLEINPSVKRDLYEALQEEGLTLKDWFLIQARSYLAQRAQPSLFDSDQVAAQKVKAKKKKEK